MKSKIVQIIPADQVWYSYTYKNSDEPITRTGKASAIALALMDDGTVQPLCVNRIGNAVIPCIELKGFKEFGRYTE